MKKTSTFQNGLIWFGAGVSLAEILTGTAFAPLGMAKGFAAILIGHVIGCAMMLLAGLIGGRTGRSAMETVKMSFGQKGGLLFAFLNVLQLVGWTAIMIYDGALAVGGIFAIGRWVWCLVIGALIILWIAVGITDLGWINKVTMAALFILTLVLCKGGHQINDADDLLWRSGTGKWFHGKRIANPNTHGTGCTLSSAIASNLAKGCDLDTSVERAKAYISGCLSAMLDLGHGSGPMDHMFALKGEFVDG